MIDKGHIRVKFFLTTDACIRLFDNLEKFGEDDLVGLLADLQAGMKTAEYHTA
ncbi:MAG: hypothetical protein KC421_17960 [Anaerolineales bacterium]|nr:hypothetical protein [Anaerolineales bacterium]